MKWTQLPVGPVQANAYILSNENLEAVIIDPGSDADRLISFIDSKRFKPVATLLTHAHFDHIGAVDEVREKWNLPVYLHKEEQDWPGDPHKNGSASFPLGAITAKPADEMINGECILHVGSFTFRVLETPGHSPGSVSFYDADNGVVFAGDALFAGSIGRTDLYRANHQQLLESIDEKLLTLPDDTIVAPGHGRETTVGTEKRTNPFLAGL